MHSPAVPAPARIGRSPPLSAPAALGGVFHLGLHDDDEETDGEDAVADDSFPAPPPLPSPPRSLPPPTPPHAALYHHHAAAPEPETDVDSPIPPPPTTPLDRWRHATSSVLRAATRSHGVLPLALAALGYATGALIVHLHMQHRVTHYLAVRGLGVDWLPVVGGAAALIVGGMYLLADAWVGELGVQGMGRADSGACVVGEGQEEPATACSADDSGDEEDGDNDASGNLAGWRRPLRFRSKRTLILRCLGGLTGINYAISKIPQIPRLLSGTLLFIVLAIFYMVDRTRRGLAISSAVAVIGTAVCHSLTARGFLAFVHPDLAGSIQSWVPVLLLASSVCIGSAARVLARLVDEAGEMVPLLPSEEEEDREEERAVSTATASFASTLRARRGILFASSPSPPPPPAPVPPRSF
ncbi:Insulin-induced protein 1 protein [Blastocladiella emersonii ATCC 22665]|nr:Insulin-induced protein 1 protein [Blastocladiella emersonii ATCC 22665]